MCYGDFVLAGKKEGKMNVPEEEEDEEGQGVLPFAKFAQ